MVDVQPSSAFPLERGVSELLALDPDFAPVVEAYGPPPVRTRPAGFPTLLRIIVDQQVSTASAAAIWARLGAALRPLAPETVLSHSETDLRALGLSQQKARYARVLAEELTTGRLDLDGLHALADEEAIAALTRVRGIGRWTAEIYLLSALQRPDVWPAADLALMVAAQELKGLGARPSAKEMILLGEAWRPWRAVAARLLWHYYRGRRGRDTGL